MGHYGKRLRALSDSLSSEERLLVSPGPSLYYLTGCWREIDRFFPVLAVGSASIELFFPEALVGKVDIEPELSTVSFSDRESFPELLSSEFDVCEKILVEENFNTERLLELQRKVSCEFTSADLVRELRSEKEEQEVERIRRASGLVDEVMQDVREIDAVGMTEKELACMIDTRMIEKGADRPAFDTVVASGPNGADPHHYPGGREIKEGEPVVIDFGARVSHYCSDQTRTLVFGEGPSKKAVEVHEAVLESQKAGLERIEPGVESSQVDRACRDVLEDRGFGDNFIHSTGHGVGLEVHEKPRVSRNSSQFLERNMVLTVEPGVYIDGEFGVRIEDTVIVTKDGCERLNKTKREMM